VLSLSFFALAENIEYNKKLPQDITKNKHNIEALSKSNERFPVIILTAKIIKAIKVIIHIIKLIFAFFEFDITTL